jgi:hypothetical protein
MNAMPMTAAMLEASRAAMHRVASFL